MANPYLPNWEYIPDGEPRVFGDRVYIYGSHDRAGSDEFCDYKLKVWSASTSNLNQWTCHGVSFQTKADAGRKADTDWTEGELYAPDVVEKDGKYYLFAYILGSKGCVAVSDKPEGPFQLISTYQYPKSLTGPISDGQFVDPGVLVDDDGRVYVYCGFLKSFMAELNAENMTDVIEGSYQEDIIPSEKPFEFFEACSPRKIGDTYYMIYSPTPPRCSCLVYATSKSPTGPFEYRGVIVDSGNDYPGGNNHGSICKIGEQWYIFYHRMTNNSIMSRRGCVEKIAILPDGSIPQVETTSLGFEDTLSPFKVTPADLACVLTGGAYITERNIFSRPITNITTGCVAGYKYYDFGTDFSDSPMRCVLKIRGCGSKGRISIMLDDYTSEPIASGTIGLDDAIVTLELKRITGRHAVFFKFEDTYIDNDLTQSLQNRALCELEEFVFEI